MCFELREVLLRLLLVAYYCARESLVCKITKSVRGYPLEDYQTFGLTSFTFS